MKLAARAAIYGLDANRILTTDDPTYIQTVTAVLSNIERGRINLMRYQAFLIAKGVNEGKL